MSEDPAFAAFSQEVVKLTAGGGSERKPPMKRLMRRGIEGRKEALALLGLRMSR